MSEKARSPDNAACEGFFGRLKDEFFCYREWTDVPFVEFSKRVDGYIDYYNNRRKKKALAGWARQTADCYWDMPHRCLGNRPDLHLQDWRAFAC